MKKKKNLTIGELTKNYDQFIKGKELNKNNKELFEKALKKAVTVKPRSSK